MRHQSRILRRRRGGEDGQIGIELRAVGIDNDGLAPRAINDCANVSA
jgi:hypothetical protein